MKYTKVFLIFVLFIFLGGCSFSGAINGDSISTPRNENITIAGTWNITKYKIVNEKLANKTVLDNMIGNTIGFGKDSSFFNDEIVMKPRYYSRKSSSSYFFVNYYNVNPRNLNINEYEIDIVTVYSEDKVFIEFIPMNEDNGIVYYEGAFLYIERISREEPNYSSDSERINEIASNDSSSGILLSLGSDYDFKRVDEKDVNQPTYRTIWISWHNDNLKAVYQMDNIIIPRSREFWSIGVNRTIDNDSSWEKLRAVNLENKSLNNSNETANEIKRSLDRYININFVGVDYMTVEILEEHKSGLYSRKLKAIPIDNINKEEGVKLEGVNLSDIVGNIGKTTIEQSAEADLNYISKEERERIESKPREDSFTLRRRTGHWIMVGRLNSILEGYEDRYLDFDINILPTSKLVGTDQLFISWNKVKEELPEVIDIFTSPNRDFAIALTKEELIIYRINKGAIIDIPLFSLKLEPTERIVMAQWATGVQVDKWNETVKELGERIKNK